MPMRGPSLRSNRYTNYNSQKALSLALLIKAILLEN